MTTSPARTRLSPDARRAQLLELGVQLFASRSVDEISIDVLAEEAGVSRGLMYHYFGSKQDFRLAVIRHAVEDLVEKTAPPAEGSRWSGCWPRWASTSTTSSTTPPSTAPSCGPPRAAPTRSAGSTSRAGSALTDRIFREDAVGEIVKDTPQSRLVVRAWSAMTEEMVLAWADDPSVMTRDELLSVLALSLPVLVDLT
ncbi:TetR/AcrR family transcriptional regulator [Nocardioides sp. B-3]|uniref:TetR/AcrR family transcriptional regulator n=1 Tax=Nocardioides sp. B-3 TaxID=2895565 RepID=UPI002152E086|nr:TetR/AcrR family transcriptional regulator [Nocardioides sp. B-3]UUZ60496.1 TetR/AcrR family transcriptional regulator [Nocardioides sp. B-3]